MNKNTDDGFATNARKNACYECTNDCFATNARMNVLSEMHKRFFAINARMIAYYECTNENQRISASAAADSLVQRAMYLWQSSLKIKNACRFTCKH